MLRRLIIIAVIATFLSAALCVNFAYGKYTMKVNVGSLQISVVQEERRSQLSDSGELNSYFRSNSVRDVKFDSYDNYPQMRRMRGTDVGEYGESATDDDKVKMYIRGNTAYILSENVIYASSLEGMFKNCSSLRSVEFSNFDVRDVKSMKEMFANCTSLTKAVFNFDAGKTEDMSRMFYRCGNLTSIDLSKFDTSSVKNMDEMFESCRNLVSIYVSERWSTQSVITGRNMFRNCVKLQGGNGTKYRWRDVSYTMARIDKNGTAGYLTAETSE